MIIYILISLRVVIMTEVQIFYENYLHELPNEIQMHIIDLSKKNYCDLKIICKKHNIFFDKSIISKKLNKYIICKFVYTIKNIEYVENPDEDLIGYTNMISNICNYKDMIIDSLKSHIKKFIKYYPQKYIRKILYNYDIYDAEELYKRDYLNSYDTALEEYGCYEKALYTEILLKSYYYVYDIYPK